MRALELDERRARLQQRLVDDEVRHDGADPRDRELDALWQALRAGDVNGLQRHAHRIAGASRSVGAHAVAAEASRLEFAAHSSQDGAELERLAQALRETAAR
ncbi:MAG TPA: Hpt domain-containing protein [Solirubrobacteraceae bacterium]